MKKDILPVDMIESKIYFIRGKKVLLDSDLASLYQVKTQVLNQAVKRNWSRFPVDFMFQLNDLEASNLISQIVISSYGGRRHNPYVFTEQGVAMLSSILKSERAIQVNIQIMRTFTKIREMIVSNKDLREKIEKLEKRYDKNFSIVFSAIKKLMTEEEKPKNEIGFNI
jgi:hypothetical protein